MVVKNEIYLNYSNAENSSISIYDPYIFNRSSEHIVAGPDDFDKDCERQDTPVTKSEENTRKWLQDLKMGLKKINWWWFSMDLTAIVLLLVLVGLVEKGYLPSVQGGFFCNDPKISHKFTGDTVGAGLLIFITLIVPYLMFCLNEFAIFVPIFRHSVPSSNSRFIWFRQASKYYRDYFLGVTLVLVIVEVGKISVGEPRPHFLDSCRPDTGINCTEGFITEYKCTNKHLPSFYITDSNRSFPSGHSALSAFTAFFSMWYLHERFHNVNSVILKPLLQTVWTAWLLYCPLSRITDNRHHWWDTLAGSIIGVIGACYTVSILTKKFKYEEEDIDSCCKSQYQKATNGSCNGVVVKCNGMNSMPVNNALHPHQSIRRLISTTESCIDEENELSNINSRK